MQISIDIVVDESNCPQGIRHCRQLCDHIRCFARRAYGKIDVEKIETKKRHILYEEYGYLKCISTMP